MTHTLAMNKVLLWAITYRAVILICLFPVGLLIHDLWILLFRGTDEAKRDREKTAAQSPEIQTAASRK